MEKTIVEGSSMKLNFLLIISGLITAFFLILGIDMAIAGDSNTWLWFTIAIVCIIVTIIIYGVFSNCKITVTDKRIFGKGGFGKTIDLPLDSVSAVMTTLITQGVSVSTSSGRITFFFLSDREDIANEIRKLLIERQEKSDAVSPMPQKTSNTDDLKKYKELLDSGIITQEEFDAKKKQLLGL